MVTVSSYIKYSESFIPITNSEDISAIAQNIDKDYIEGAIVLSHYSQSILSFDHWDHIVELWSYMISMMEEYVISGYAETYFPDQPICLQMAKKPNDMCLFKVDSEAFYISDKEFLGSLISEYDSFINCMRNNFGSDLPNQHEKIMTIKKYLYS